MPSCKVQKRLLHGQYVPLALTATVQPHNSNWALCSACWCDIAVWQLLWLGWDLSSLLWDAAACLPAAQVKAWR
jgi:hypothetical protein